jgi:hypothetical protein
MLIKADCLHKAGIINEAENQWVNSKARTFLDDTTLKDAAWIAADRKQAPFPAALVRPQC